MADDSFTSQDINELRQLHDHLVSTNDPRAPQLRTFLQSQNAMGPPPAPYPIAPGITQPFGGFGNYQGYHPSLAAQWTRASEIPEGVGNLLTGHPWAGAAQLAQPALIATPIGAAASDIAASGLESLPGLMGRAGLAGLSKYLGEINLFKPFTPITGLGSAWDAARASWLANAPKPPAPTEFGPAPPVYGPMTSSTARFAEPLPGAKAPTAAPPVYYPPKSAAVKEPIVSPPPVYYPPRPGEAAGPPPPPVYYPPKPQEATGRPVVPPPPVKYNPQPATGAPKPAAAPRYPQTSSTARFAEEAGVGQEGETPVTPKPMTPEQKLADRSSAAHATAGQVDMGAASPPGKSGHAVLSDLAKQMGLPSSKAFTAEEWDVINGVMQNNERNGLKRPPTLQEVQDAFQRAGISRR